jgi:rubrerythrin
MNKYGFVMLNDSNAEELAELAEDVGALAFRGQLQYPGPDTGEWELDSDVISDILYELRDREVLLLRAPVEGEPMHLCGICGFVPSGPGEPCPRCALINEDVAAAIDAKRVADSAAEWLKDHRH